MRIGGVFLKIDADQGRTDVEGMTPGSRAMAFQRVADYGAGQYSGGWSYCHVEGEGLSGGIVIGGIAFKSERNGGHAVLLGVVT